MNDIYQAIVNRVSELTAIGIAAVLIAACLLRLRKNRRREVVEQPRSYNCLSSKMTWGSSDVAGDDKIQCRRVERITPRTCAGV